MLVGHASASLRDSWCSSLQGRRLLGIGGVFLLLTDVDAGVNPSFEVRREVKQLPSLLPGQRLVRSGCCDVSCLVSG